MRSISSTMERTAYIWQQTRSYDLVILDIYIPKLDGFAVLKRLREQEVTTPVLLLTIRATIEDKVLGLDLGADDYLTKPFAFEELLARVRALLRRRTNLDNRGASPRRPRPRPCPPHGDEGDAQDRPHLERNSPFSSTS